MGVTQVYTLGDSVAFELNDDSVVSFKYSDVNEGLLSLLDNLSKELGRTPTFDDVLSQPKMPHPNTYSFYFGSFDKAKEIIEGRIRLRKWKESRAQNEKNEGGKTMTKKGLLTDDRLLELIHDRFMKLGRLPSCKEINGDPELPSYATVFQRLGNKKEIQSKLRKLSEQIGSGEGQSSSTPKPEGKPTIPDKEERTADEIIKILADVVQDAQATNPPQPTKESPGLEASAIANKDSATTVSDESSGPSGPNKMVIELDDVQGVKTINLTITLKISLSK